MQEWRDAVWEAVPADAEPERFAARLAFLREHVAPGDRVLDLGCGDGHFAAGLLGLAGTVIAADVSSVALERAARRAARSSATIETSAATTSPARPSSPAAKCPSPHPRSSTRSPGAT